MQNNQATLIMSYLGALVVNPGGKYPSHTKKGPGRRRALTEHTTRYNIMQRLAVEWYDVRNKWCLSQQQADRKNIQKDWSLSEIEGRTCWLLAKLGYDMDASGHAAAAAYASEFGLSL